MSDGDARDLRGSGPLLLVSAAVVLVAFGFAYGVRLSNLHNGLLGLAFTSVGAYVLHQRPGQTEGRLFLATGLVESVLFLGRQIGHASSTEAGRWLGWLGVWPTAIALGLTTLSVIRYPDGRLPSDGWRWCARAICAVCAACAAASAVWPVEYVSAGLRSAHPVVPEAPDAIAAVGPALVHSVYVALQLLWVVAVVVRYRASGGHVRRQVAAVLIAAGGSALALVVGLVVGRTPVPGLLSAAVVPVVAGWAIVHRQHAVAYSALTWLSRTRTRSADLPSELARAVAEALGARSAVLWVGHDVLHAVGVWPRSGDPIPPTTLHALHEDAHLHARTVLDHGAAVGAVSIEGGRTAALSIAEHRLLDDLASQATLVIDHLGLSAVVTRRREAALLRELTERERTVLELMARGLSNGAICEELHLSIKTVEPVVSTIFTKLGLPPGARDNRRVLAVVAFLQT